MHIKCAFNLFFKASFIPLNEINDWVLFSYFIQNDAPFRLKVFLFTPFWSKFHWASGVVTGGITTRLQWGAKMKEVRGVLLGFAWEGHLLSPLTSKEQISLYIDYQLMQIKIV
jgi:hypothetical protein